MTKRVYSKNIRWFAKPDTWFDTNTEAKLMSEIWWQFNKPIALFEGLRDGEPDQEICGIDEFELKFICKRCNCEVWENTVCSASNFSLLCVGDNGYFEK